MKNKVKNISISEFNKDAATIARAAQYFIEIESVFLKYGVKAKLTLDSN